MRKNAKSKIKNKSSTKQNDRGRKSSLLKRIAEFAKAHKIILLSSAAGVIVLVLAGVLIFGRAEVMLDVEYNKTASEHYPTQQELDEYYAVILNENEEDTESKSEPERPYDIESVVNEMAVVRFEKKKYFINAESVECTVTAPDMYSYFLENLDAMMESDEATFYDNAMEYLHSDNCKMRTVTLTLPVRYFNHKLIAETGGDEYKDAVSGGMYSALEEIARISYEEELKKAKEEQ